VAGLVITSDIKLVSYSSTITMMHSPIYIYKIYCTCSSYIDLYVIKYSTYQTSFKFNMFHTRALNYGI